MADAHFIECYHAWIAHLSPESEIVQARADLHRFVPVLLSPGFKSVAERRLEAEFDALTRRLPWLIGQERGADFDRMAAALRDLAVGPVPSGNRSFWNPPRGAFDTPECAQHECDACYHFLNAVARRVLAASARDEPSK